MLVNYFKLKNISKRGQRIALAVVGGVFIFLSLISIWQRNFVDTLINYAPDDAVFYAHFSQPKINNSAPFENLLNKILSDSGLPDLTVLNIDREMAVAGRLAGGEIKYGLIIKTDRPSRTRKIIEAAGRPYRFLAYNKIVVADSDQLKAYQKNRRPALKLAVKKSFYPLSSITLYAAPEFFGSYNDDLFLNFIFGLLKNANGDLVLNFKTQRQGLKVLTGGLSSAVRTWDKFPVKEPKETINGDLVLAVSDLKSVLINWQDNLKSISTWDYKIFSDSQWKTYLNTYLPGELGGVLLSIEKNQNNFNWLVSDYDFYLLIAKAYPAKVEEILKVLMANHYPSAQNIYLSDGTKVTELLPDIKRWDFLEKNGAQYLYSPDNQFKLIYRSLGHNIIITNSEELLAKDWPQPDFNYLRFNSAWLPDDGAGRYLKSFGGLEVTSKGLFLR